MATLKNIIRDSVDDADDGISELASATRRRARSVGKRVQNAASDGQELATDLFADTLTALRSAGQLIRERPVSTATAMIVGGLLVGGLYAFLRRR